MASYDYKAIRAGGDIIEGSITAKDRAEVMEMLRDKEYRPIKIEETKEAQNADVFQSIARVKIKHISIFCRQFYTMLHSGISIIQCLDILRQQFDNVKLRGIIGEIYDQVQKGSALSESMRMHKDVFPELLMN
ncbi:MAG: type II secretion system F family protein, partial [Clostridiaceae bacterium]|nr:type II secretion system F family protein [Clostridiaceae bacterium]